MNGEQLKGQKELVLKNGEKVVLEYTMNSLVELEKKYGKFANVMEQFQDISFENILYLIWSGTIDNHDHPMKYIGRHFDLGNFQECVEIVQSAFSMAFPSLVGEEDGMTEKGREILEKAKKKD